MRFLFFLLPFFLFACYSGNPADPGIMDVGVFSFRNPFIKATSGYLADYTFVKHYQASSKNPSFDPNDLFREFGVHSQMATFSAILLQRMEVWGAVGGAKERAKWQQGPSLTDPYSFWVDFQSAYHFGWMAGGKVILIQWGQTFLCTNFSYLSVPASSNSTFSFFNRLNLQFVEKQEFSLNEWQICAALASRFWIFTPYISGLYLNSNLSIRSGPITGSIDYHNQNRWGWLYGITLSLTGRLHLNFEQRFASENAYGFAGTLVF